MTTDIIAVDDDLLARLADGSRWPHRAEAAAMAVELIATRAVICPPDGTTTLHDRLAELDARLHQIANDLTDTDPAVTQDVQAVRVTLDQIITDVGELTP